MMVKKILAQFLFYARLRPFDRSTPAGVDQERNRVALLSIITNAGSKGGAILLIFAGMSWTMPYLGSERFGVWMTILSLSIVLSFMDLGVGNSLTNLISKSYIASRDVLIDAYTGGLSIMVILAFFMYLILRGVDQFIPWGFVFKTINPEVLAEAEQALFVFYVCFAIQLFSSAVVRAHAGMQKAYRANILNLVLTLIAILVMYFAAREEVNIAILVGITLSPVCLSGFLIFASQIYKGVYDPRRIRSSIRKIYQPVLSIGGLFFVLQIAAMIGWGGDTLIVSSIIGVGGVAAFAIAQRLFQLVTQPLSIINAPLWPAYANAHAQGDSDYIRRLFKRSLFFTFGFGSVSALFVALFAPWASQYLSKSTVELSLALIVLCAIWAIVESTGNALGVLLNGIGVIRYQVIISSTFAIFVLPIKICLTAYCGVEGLVFSNIIVYLSLVIVPYIYLFLSNRISFDC